MDLRKLLLAIGAGMVIGGSALAAPKAPPPQKVEVINTVQTSEVAKPEKPDPKDAPCDPPKDVRTSDLCAQWKAADAADRAALWTIVSFVVGTIVNVATLIFVGLSFTETRKSSNAAVDAAKAAMNTLQAERAWMTISKIEVGQPHVVDGGECYVNIGVTWTNIGRSVAINTNYTTGFNPDAPETAPHFGEENTKESGINSPTLAPGANETPILISVPIQSLDDAKSGKIVPCIYASVTYQDIFFPSLIRKTEVTRLIIIDGSEEQDYAAVPFGPQNMMI